MTSINHLLFDISHGKRLNSINKPNLSVISQVIPSNLLDVVHFNQDGLIPAIAQQHDSGQILMMAWMSQESLAETLQTGRVCYWSRSRGKLWRKGESSGQVQMLQEIRIDCDGDTLLLQVDQTGPACHTGRRSCFYRTVRGDQIEVIDDPLIDPSELYGHKMGKL